MPRAFRLRSDTDTKTFGHWSDGSELTEVALLGKITGFSIR